METVTLPSLPPNPCLVAILLVVKSRSGPSFVFHYPPHPRADRSSAHTVWYGNASITDESSAASGDDSDWSSSSEEDEENDGPPRPQNASEDRTSYRLRKLHNPDEDEDEDDSTGETKRGLDWESVLGFGAAGLEKMLSPGVGFRKKRFEMSLDELVFLGWPVFVREDGHWKKPKRKKKQKRKGKKSGDESEITDGAAYGTSDAPTSDYESGQDEELLVTPDSTAEGHEKKDSMSMFHVVFVLNPPSLEYQIRVREMYDNVVKKFAKALKYEQARSNYVYKESKLVLALKDKAKEDGLPMSTLWSSILTQSTLAKAISSLYSAISSSQIAQIVINSSFDISVQIPKLTETSTLPSITEPQMPGLWLTTANLWADEDQNEDNFPGTHFGLLLLDDIETILKEIETDAKELSAPLAHYIRCSTPTKSFLQISTMHKIPLSDIRFLASHLIYWRKARAIPPLHQRDTYIVSPNADMRTLPAAIDAYAARFPTLPKLAKMLSMLSGIPRPFSSIIPSKDHRPAYLDILAWLMRGGWVTQLRTFGWVRIPPEVKRAVALEIQHDDASISAKETNGTHKENGKLEYHGRPGPSDVDNGVITPPRIYIDADGEDDAPLLILDPHKATELESRYLKAVPDVIFQASAERLPQSASSSHSSSANNTPRARPADAQPIQQEDANLDRLCAMYWPSFSMYFNGMHALEKIPGREGLKRKEVGRILARMEALGCLTIARHW